MAEEEALRGHGAEHAGVGVLLDLLGRHDVDQVGVVSALVLDVDVGDLDVLDRVAGDAAEDGADAASRCCS